MSHRAEFIRQARVLIIDDDDGCRELLAACLVPMGCAVAQADNGRDGMERFESGGWDVVLMDLNMPGMSGFEVLEKIRETHPMEKLPVIMITGQDDMDTRV